VGVEGKVVVVTGGSHGIGAAIATLAARRGARVAICGRSDERLAARSTALRAEGLGALACRCDVRDAAQVASFAERVRTELGPVDVLVNNAGGWAGEPLAEISHERLLALLDTTVRGTLLTTRAVLGEMIERRSGFILNIGSTSGLLSSRDGVAATTPKAALAGLTAALRNEVRGSSIGVAVLHPAAVASDGDRAGDGRVLSPAQVAEIALFVVEQPRGVLVRELVVTPLHADV
jgi:3-oxoacyl-[acyl-carrier protein] reductase